MASAIAPGQFKVVVEDPVGNQYPQLKGDNQGAIAAGGSPDGVLANTTIDKQVRVGTAARPVVATGGFYVRLFVKLSTADGLDVSDGVFQVAITEDSGAERQLSASDFGISTDIPAATPANQWFELGTGYAVPNNLRILVGSRSLTTPTVISIQNDTA